MNSRIVDRMISLDSRMTTGRSRRIAYAAPVSKAFSVSMRASILLVINDCIGWKS